MAKKLTDEEVAAMLGQRQPNPIATVVGVVSAIVLSLAIIMLGFAAIVWAFRYVFL